MIPVRLTLQGIYSYQQTQTIDFEKLTESGLFGIFGMVGSGKSTLLEAISYVLYGKVERLNNQDKLAYNLMNLRSNQLLIDYEFRTGRKNTLYRFVIKSARKKNFEEIHTAERSQYVWENDTWIPSELDASEILELSYDNFRRTIIIPQGKFQEFLQLGNKDRTLMLEDIFNLQEFDFTNKLTPIETANKEDLLTTQTQLEQVEYVYQEMIAEKEEALKSLEQEIRSIQTELGQKTQSKAEQEQTQQLFLDIKNTRSALEELEREKPAFELLASQVKDYETCFFLFHHLIESRNKSKNKRDEIGKEFNSKEIQNQQITEKLKLEETRFTELKTRHDQKENLLQKAEDLEKIIRLKELSELIAQANIRIENGEKESNQKKAEQQKLNTKNEELAGQIRLKKDELPDFNVLNAVKEWFAKQDRIKIQSQNTEREKKNLLREIESIQARKEKIVSEFFPSFTGLIAEEEKLMEQCEHWRQQNQLLLKETEIKRAQLEFQKLNIQNLKEGEPCPLCGSLDHPAVTEIHNFDEEIGSLSLQNEELGVINQQIEKGLRQLLEVRSELKNKNAQLESKEKDYSKLSDEMNKHFGDFNSSRWKGFDPYHPGQVVKNEEKYTRLSLEISKLEKEKSETERQLKTVVEEGEKYRTALEKIKNEFVQNQAEFQNIQKGLKHLLYDDFKEQTKAALQNRSDTFRNDYRQLTDEFNQLEQQLSTQRNEKGTLDGQLMALQKNLEKETGELTAIENEIESKLLTTNFQNLERVENILNQPLDLESSKSKLNAYNKQREVLRETLLQLEKQSQSKAFEEEAYLALVNEIEKLNQRLLEARKEETRHEENLKKHKEDLKNKIRLSEKLRQLELRSEDITTLKNLFRGKGFVNFISSVNLQNLCNLANERFYRLTRQQLRLELSDANDFLVRDYLNNGQIRSIKTLSGGQTFQASLSLALALADSIQKFTDSAQNFFFLDEGFGSQDDESLELVFDTLAGLRKENRIVGIISHVEKLQDEIKVFLRVKNEEEKGSTIQKSWEM